MGSLFAKTCQQNQDQIWEYLSYLLFLAEGVSALPEDQLAIVDELVEKLQKDPEGGMQEIMKMIQESADSMGDAGASSLAVGGAGPVDEMFASMSKGCAPGNLGLDLDSIFLPKAAKQTSADQPLPLTVDQPSGARTAYLPDGPSDSAIIEESKS